MKHLLALLLVGCASPIATPDQIPQFRIDAALAAWEANGNSVGTCRETTPSLRFLPQAELRVWCQADFAIWGCVVEDLILIEETASPHQRTLALEHELRHWMSSCSLGSTDAHHFRDRSWYPHPETGEDVRTAETWGYSEGTEI